MMTVIRRKQTTIKHPTKPAVVRITLAGILVEL